MTATADFFGMSTAADTYSNALIQRILSPFYSVERQDSSTVVIIDDKSLLQRSKTWPLSYADHAQLISQILMLQPKAIFVDILFDRERDRDDSLQELVEEIELFAGKLKPSPVGPVNEITPVIFASGMMGKKAIIPALEKVVPIASTGWNGMGTDYPLYLADVSNGAPKETVAYKLFKMLCSGENAASFCPSSQVNDQDFIAPLNVQWGLAVPPQQKQFFKTDNCKTVDPGFTWQTLDYMREFLWKGLTSNTEELNGDYQPCRFTLTLSYQHFANPEIFDAPFFQEAIRDRVVFYGQSLEGIHDVVLTPTNGQIPGVYLHAMAFDNLLKYGKNYIAHPIEKIGPYKIDELIEIILGVVLVLAAVYWKTYQGPHTNAQHDNKRSMLVFFIISIVPTVALSIYLHMIQHYAPINWLGLIGLNAFILTLLRNDSALELVEKGKGLWGRVFLGAKKKPQTKVLSRRRLGCSTTHLQYRKSRWLRFAFSASRPPYLRRGRRWRSR